MTITQSLIRDLLPAYFSGEASSDTCKIVDEYFRRNPAFRDEVAEASEVLRTVGAASVVRGGQGGEKAALIRAKSILRWQRVLLSLASSLTLNAILLGFSFEIAGSSVRLHWLIIPGQGKVVGAILAVAAILWIAYIRATRRVRSEVLS